MKKLKVEKKLKWVKPTIKVEELTMRSLLGENGWMEYIRNTDRRLSRLIAT